MMTIISIIRCCEVYQSNKIFLNLLRYCSYNIKHHIQTLTFQLTFLLKELTLKTMEPFLNKKYKLERCDNLNELLDEMGE